MARLVRVFAPGQIDKIAVWQLKALPVRGKAQFTANQPRHGFADDDCPRRASDGTHANRFPGASCLWG